MNSYYDDEPPHAPRGQARVPGNAAFGPSDDGYDPFDPFAESQGGAGAGQSRGGSYGGPQGGGYEPGAYEPGGYQASQGGGYQGGYNDDEGYAPGAPVPPAPISPARGSVGRASVRPPSPPGGGGRGGFDDGFDPFADEPDSGGPAGASPAGRASGAVGRAGVGRASVPGRPGGPAGPGGPGGPAGPGGPTRPGGPGGSGGARPGDSAGGKKNKKARRRNRIIAAFAATIMLIGLLVVGVTYYSASIPLPADQAQPQSTTLYYSDGKTEMARIGEENRILIPLSQVPVDVRHAVVATEDETFYSNVGVDFKGIARAFVNNVTGGQTQGASTITQQYARHVANLTTEASYTRKMKEIVIAYKLHNKYSKDQILEFYLNTVLFGRGAYGIEAAAEAYFGKHAADLTLPEGMVLAGLIKDPNGGIYDPSENLASAQKRWTYTKDQLLKLGYITKDVHDKMAYPTSYIKPKDLVGSEMDTATGFIIHHVMSELSSATHNGKPVFPSDLHNANSLKLGGYRIYTTIDKNAQAAAVKYADPASSKSPMTELKKGAGAALVAVQPGTGNVIAYYGGENGAGIDRAGIFNDPVTSTPGWSGANQIPGSSFKTITMATALQQGLSVNSYWYGPEVLTVQGRSPIHNVVGEDCAGAAHICTMWMGLKKSLNTMYYEIGLFKDPKAGITMSPAKIVNMAANLGIQNIWPDASCNGGARIQLDGKNGDKYTSNGCVKAEVAFGEYGVAVQDMANVIATYAASGVRATEHFVDHVTKGTGGNVTTVYKSDWITKLVAVPGMNKPKWDDLTWSMQQVYANHSLDDKRLANGRQAAAKTGTWQLPTNEKKNGWVFFNGFTAHGAGNPAGSNGQIAATVAITYTGNKPAPVVFKSNGHNVSSHDTPAKIWQLFVDSYVSNGPHGKPFPVEKFDPPANTGDPNIGGEPSPTPTIPSPNPSDSGCVDPSTCPASGPPTPITSDTPAGPLTINVDKGSLPQSVKVSWDNAGQGPIIIDWGDGKSSNGSGNQGQRQHAYAVSPQAKQYTITVTDADDSSRKVTKTITIPWS